MSVNAICPGIIATDLLRGLLGHRQAELTTGIALGRVGTPEDIASIVRYLAVEAHMSMTGQLLQPGPRRYRVGSKAE